MDYVFRQAQQNLQVELKHQIPPASTRALGFLFSYKLHFKKKEEKKNNPHSCLLTASSILHLTIISYTQAHTRCSSTETGFLLTPCSCYNKTFKIQNTYYKRQLQQRTHSIRPAEALCQTVKPTQSFPSQNATPFRPISTKAIMTSTSVLPRSPSRFAEA